MGWYFPTLGLSLALGLLLGEWLAHRRGVPTKVSLLSAAILMLCGLIGARLFHVFFEGLWPYYQRFPLDILMPWKGGLSIIGGMIGSLFGLLFIRHLARGYLATLASAFTPPLFFGLALARVGCFLNGCCHGAPTDIPWAVHMGKTGLFPCDNHHMKFKRTGLYVKRVVFLTCAFG
jgi:phosphatidylglycerol:prolipoprotein diacylglycerol transferase